MSNPKHSENNQSEMVQPCKPKRKSVQFGRVSYSDDPSTTNELTPCKQGQKEIQFKHIMRSAMTSSKQDTPCIPPSPPQRQVSVEVFDLDESDFSCSPIISMNYLLKSLSMGSMDEEEKEDEDDSNHSHGSHNSNGSFLYNASAPSLPKRRPHYLCVSPSRQPSCLPVHRR